MFAGKYDAVLDDKFRVTIPAKFRLFLRSQEDREGFFLTSEGKGANACLCLYPYSAWRKVVDRVQRSGDTALMRRLAVQAEFAALDQQGRMVIPRELAAQAGLERDALLVGVHHWIEIWTPGHWQDANPTGEGLPPADYRHLLMEPDIPSGGEA